MQRLTKVVQSNAQTVRLAKPQLGFNPADTHRQFQVSCKGLLGGTFTVSFVPAGSDHEIVFSSNLNETELVLSAGDSFLYEVMLVTFNNLGAGANPEVVATFWQKGL